MINFFELLTDKRFSLKFRILNLLSGDYLRNYLSSGVLYYIDRCDEIVNIHGCPDAYKIKTIKSNILKAKNGLNDIWKI